MPVARIPGFAEKSVTGAITVGIPAKGVHLAAAGGVDWQAKIGKGVQIALNAVAPVHIGLRNTVALDNHAAIGHGISDAVHVAKAAVGTRAIGGFALQVLTKQAERPAAELQANTTAHVVGGAVVFVTLAWTVLARVRVDERRKLPFLEHDVHHTGDGVGAVLRGRPVAQHFDAFDRAGRKGVQIDTAGARRRAVGEHIQQRGGMAALTIDQHQ